MPAALADLFQPMGTVDHPVISYHADFRCESSSYVTMSVNLKGPGLHSKDGKLSITPLSSHDRVARYAAVYSLKGNDKGIKVAFSDDGLSFTEGPQIAGAPYDDASIISLLIAGNEHLFVFSETRNPAGVGVVAAVFHSEDGGRSWNVEAAPLADFGQVPTVNYHRPGGMSIPTAILARDHEHIWVFWSLLHNKTPDTTLPNNVEVFAGFIPIVNPQAPSEFLSLESGGELSRMSGRLEFVIDQKNRKPLIPLDRYHWCSGGIDIGNVVYEGNYYYMVFRACSRAENYQLSGHTPVNGSGEERTYQMDYHSCGIARSRNLYDWEIRPHPILIPSQLGIHHGISYPALFAIDDAWYLYYVVPSTYFGSISPTLVPNPGECHARLKLTRTV